VLSHHTPVHPMDCPTRFVVHYAANESERVRASLHAPVHVERRAGRDVAVVACQLGRVGEEARAHVLGDPPAHDYAVAESTTTAR